MTTRDRSPRIAGYCARLAEPVSIEPWKPLFRTEVEALPPLPPPPVRGWKIDKPAPPPAAVLTASPPTSPAPPKDPESPFSLKEIPASQLAPFLTHQHPQTIALTLSQLDLVQAAGILAQLPERLQADVAYRVATLEYVPPANLKLLAESLEVSLRDVLGGTQHVGGPKLLADIINLAGTGMEKKILSQLEAQDPKVAESVRDLMFTFDDLVKLTDRELQVLLCEVEHQDLAVALKNANEAVKEKIFSNMSEQVRTFITEEVGHISPMRLSEVEEVQRRILQKVRDLEEKGQIAIVRGSAADRIV